MPCLNENVCSKEMATGYIVCRAWRPCRPKLVRTKDHDVILIGKILVFRPFAFTFGSRERGQSLG